MKDDGRYVSRRGRRSARPELEKAVLLREQPQLAGGILTEGCLHAARLEVDAEQATAEVQEYHSGGTLPPPPPPIDGPPGSGR